MQSLLLCFLFNHKFHKSFDSISAFCSFFTEVRLLTLSNQLITVTLHDYSKSWNEAQQVCEAEGGNLFVEDSEERSIMLELYKSSWNV